VVVISTLAPFLQVDRPAVVRSAGPAFVQRLVGPWDSLRGESGRCNWFAGETAPCALTCTDVPMCHEVAAGSTSQALLSDPSVPASAESMPARVKRAAGSCPQDPVETVWTRASVCGGQGAFCGQHGPGEKEFGEVGFCPCGRGPWSRRNLSPQPARAAGNRMRTAGPAGGETRGQVAR